MKPASHLPPASPALVTHKAAQRLPRVALWLFCAAYVLPGLLGRDPWKNEDIAAFGQMWSLALGQASWWQPHVGGIVPQSGGILPYWLGGASIALLGSWVDPAVAARLPFALLLTSVLGLTWYATYELARTDAAQPLPLAFGGEARPQDYARAVADGALLALMASLGLLQLGHETTPELLQLTGAALLLFGLCAVGHRPQAARWATLTSLPVMAASGSPTVAMLLGAAATLVCLRSQQGDMRGHLRWVLLATALATSIATALSVNGLPGWGWRIAQVWRPSDIAQLLVWFAWPTLPLAVLTCWHWRQHMHRRHIATPLLLAGIGIASAIAMGGKDRALLIALPPLAVLAAFCLPVLQRSLGAAIDWFSVCFFTACVAAIWLGYVAVQTGEPARTAANVLKLVPGARVSFSWVTLALGLAGTSLWLWLVRWRTARRSHALWKSLILPAGGVALCWLLLMTLWLPLLDQARSYRSLIQRVSQHMPRNELVCAPGASVGLLTGLEYFGGYRVNGTDVGTARRDTGCGSLVLRIQPKSLAPRVAGWQAVGQYNQRTRNSELIVVYRRNTTAP
jgi:hypothetical protein